MKARDVPQFYNGFSCYFKYMCSNFDKVIKLFTLSCLLPIQCTHCLWMSFCMDWWYKFWLCLSCTCLGICHKASNIHEIVLHAWMKTKNQFKSMFIGPLTLLKTLIGPSFTYYNFLLSHVRKIFLKIHTCPILVYTLPFLGSLIPYLIFIPRTWVLKEL
jgi:hypothetical protein